MSNVSRRAAHVVLERAAQAILSAAGGDRVISRAEIDAQLKLVTGDERTLIDTFYRFVDHRDAHPGARVTKSDVTAALGFAKAMLIDAYDSDRNGLSAEERARMPVIGQQAAKLAELGLTPNQAARQAVEVLVRGGWKPGALPEVALDRLSPSARASFKARLKRAEEQQGLIDAPIARQVIAGGQRYNVVAQFTHDSFGIEIYSASSGRKLATGAGWGPPEAPITWR